MCNGFFHLPITPVSLSHNVAHAPAFDKWLFESEASLGNGASLHVFRKCPVLTVPLPCNLAIPADHADSQARTISEMKRATHFAVHLGMPTIADGHGTRHGKNPIASAIASRWKPLIQFRNQWTRGERIKINLVLFRQQRNSNLLHGLGACSR